MTFPYTSWSVESPWIVYTWNVICVDCAFNMRLSTSFRVNEMAEHDADKMKIPTHSENQAINLIWLHIRR